MAEGQVAAPGNSVDGTSVGWPAMQLFAGAPVALVTIQVWGDFGVNYIHLHFEV